MKSSLKNFKTKSIKEHQLILDIDKDMSNKTGGNLSNKLLVNTFYSGSSQIYLNRIDSENKFSSVKNENRISMAK